MMRILICFFSVLVSGLLFSNPAKAEQATLEETLVQAYQFNPSLEAERAKLRAMDENVALALSHWRPKIEATTSIGKTYQRIPAQKAYNTDDYVDNTMAYGVQVTQPIFRGFRTLSETEAARKQVKSGRAQLLATEQKFLFDVSKAFLDVIRDEYILKADRENENVLRKKLQETKVRARKGDLTQTDVKQAESRLARAEVSRLETENSLSSNRATFKRLVGRWPEKLSMPNLDFKEGENVEEILRQAEARNPSVVAAKYSLDQADAQIDENKGSLLPELNLVGSSSRNYGESVSIPGRYDTTNVMLQLKIPLYEAGADHAQVRAAQQSSVQRRMELEDMRNQVRELAYKSWQGLQTTKAAIKADELQIEAAKKALEGVKIQAQVGTRTTLDELNAEQELLEARTDLARAEHDKALAVLQLKLAVGVLTAEALKLPLDPYDPKQHYEDTHALWVGFGGADDDIYIKPQGQVPSNASDDP